MFLGACGGGGGGGGEPGVVQVTGMAIQGTQRTTTSEAKASAQVANDQVTTLNELDSPPATAPASGAPPPEVGFASLRWQPPSQRVDGESLSMSEIGGYRIYYGTQSGAYDSMLSVDDPYTSMIQIDDLPLGTYYFVMTTVDTSGIESAYSREAVRIVQS